MPRQRHDERFWRERIEKWSASGVSAKEFAANTVTGVQINAGQEQKLDIALSTQAVTESVTQTRPGDRNDRTPRAIGASGISKSFGDVQVKATAHQEGVRRPASLVDPLRGADGRVARGARRGRGARR